MDSTKAVARQTSGGGRRAAAGAAWRKPELYEIIKLHKERLLEFAMDHQNGASKWIMDQINNEHSVLSLPQYHPDFNPIENIWAQTNGENSVTIKDVRANTEIMTQDQSDNRVDNFIINIRSSSEIEIQNNNVIARACACAGRVAPVTPRAPRRTPHASCHYRFCRFNKS
ncbi:hypothetical protein EVAR_9730_1 [Eumeta japonica]|uniref:Tc1-like transposase DDE domain-containing protein n=1 Tax=Eumeta variegata TaxID=151549 RepID=A0A4C1U5Z0_EUMVA|nr:hypothetical protein EVAR_9730_1 [Eumeta japonica]